MLAATTIQPNRVLSQTQPTNIELPSSQVPLPNPISHTSKATHSIGLKDRLIAKLDDCESRLIKFMPNNKCQENFDKVWEKIQAEKEDSCLNRFNQWLADNGHGQWYKQVATYLAKLPLRAAYNVLSLLFNLIKTALSIPPQLIMHPLRAPIKLAKLLVNLVHALMQPETWAKIGAGMIGSTLGQAALASNPIGLMAIGIGGALVLGGLTIGTLKTAIVAEKGMGFRDVKCYLKEQLLKMPENALTGFCMVMLLEGIQQIIRGVQKLVRNSKHANNISNGKDALAKEQARDFLEKYDYPTAEKYWRSGDNFSVAWRVERGLDGRFATHDLPDAKFFIRDLQTSTQYVTSYVWVDGYHDYATGTYVSGHFTTVTTAVPVYERFLGYELPLKGWIDPPVPPLPEAIRLSEKVVPFIGVAVALKAE